MTTNLVDSKTMQLVDEAISDFFALSMSAANEMDASYLRLWQFMHELINSGGKRLRPQMTLMAYAAFGGKNTESVVPVAAAQELLHFSLLIHDDIIDRDYVRYGTSNVAGRYQSEYANYVLSLGDRTHYANSAAILGGDLMLAGAHQMIASSSLNERYKLLAQGFLSKSIFEVAGGELLDTELTFVPYADGRALKVAKYKTASYSFVAPLLTGATLAGIGEQQAAALTTYAQSLGIAYQLIDDILGVFGDEEKTGKSTSSDITEGKRTYMVERAMQTMSDDQKVTFESLFGNPDATIEDIETVKNLLESTGARQATIEEANRYADDARAAIYNMGISAEYEEGFEKFLEKVMGRSN